METCPEAPALICSKCTRDVDNAARLKKISLLADKFFRNQTKNAEEAFYLEFKESFEMIEETLDPEEDEYELIEYVDSEEAIVEDEDWSEDKQNFEEISPLTEPKEKLTRKPYAPRKPGGGRQIHQCECGITFSSIRRLRNHVRVKHDLVPESELLQCEICDKK